MQIVHIISIITTTTDFTNFELFFLDVRTLKHVMFQELGIEKSLLRVWSWITLCQISGFCYGVVEVFTLLGRYMAQVGMWLPTFWDSLLVPSSRIKQFILFGLVTLEDGTNKLSQTSGTTYQPIPHNILEEQRPWIILVFLCTMCVYIYIYYKNVRIWN
jgi:hypothetical protein